MPGLFSGTFEASDGTLRCNGSYDNAPRSAVTQGVVACSDGRKGIVYIERATSQSGTGRVRLNDGTEADLIFGPSASGL